MLLPLNTSAGEWWGWGLLQETRDASRGGGWAPLNDDEINQTKIMKVISIATGRPHPNTGISGESSSHRISCPPAVPVAVTPSADGKEVAGWLSVGESQRVESAHLHGRKWNNFSVPSRRLECCALCSMGPRHVHSIQSPISSLLHPHPPSAGN